LFTWPENAHVSLKTIFHLFIVQVIHIYCYVCTTPTMNPMHYVNATAQPTNALLVRHRDDTRCRVENDIRS